jgi:hypothetical protein
MGGGQEGIKSTKMQKENLIRTPFLYEGVTLSSRRAVMWPLFKPVAMPVTIVKESARKKEQGTLGGLAIQVLHTISVHTPPDNYF